MKRIAWVDVLKFLGIAAIYFWHLGEGIGVSFDIILLYHVPLFFFLSGATESLQKKTSFLPFLKKKIRTLLVPYFLFALVSMALVIVYEKAEMQLILLMVKQIMPGGMRNRIFAYSLWFLTCLFVCSLLFWILRRCLKTRGKLFFTGVLCFIATARFLPYKPDMYPLLPYNADAAVYYLFYYIAGYCAFPKLNAFLEQKTKYKGWIMGAFGGVVIVYAVGLFFGRDMLAVLNKIPALRIFKPVFAAFLLIGGNILAAYGLRSCTLLQRIGKESLYLCGNEFLVKTLAVCVAASLGIGLEINGPLQGIAYVLVLLCLQFVTLVPLEKLILRGKKKNT